MLLLKATKIEMWEIISVLLEKKQWNYTSYVWKVKWEYKIEIFSTYPILK